MENMGVNETNMTLCLGSSNTRDYSTAIQTAIYCIVLIVSLVGNILVMIVVSRAAEIKATVNYFIFNMAVSDILFTIVVIPRTIMDMYSNTPLTWYLDGIVGDISCKLCYFIPDVCTAVSILTLVAIAVDRYYAVVFPMQSAVITPTVRRVLVASIWLIAMGFHSPYFFAFRVSTDPKTSATVCTYVWWNRDVNGKAYFLISSSFLFILPLIAMSVIYSAILLTIRRRKIPGDIVSSGLRRHKVKRNRKVLTMVLAVLLAFFLCWLPFNIYAYLLFFGWYTPLPCTNRLESVIILCIAYTNAAVNPFIYFSLSENYRLAAIHIIHCRTKRQLARQARENTSLVARQSSRSNADAVKKRTLKTNTELNELQQITKEAGNGDAS